MGIIINMNHNIWEATEEKDDADSNLMHLLKLHERMTKGIKRFFSHNKFAFVSAGACPNQCSLHGTCNSDGTCTCDNGWDYAADCSLRTCPTGKAWADKAYDEDTAHSTVECSNAGFCDRSKGICVCFDGFTGSACQRSTCPNECSGHGLCITVANAGLFYGPWYDVPGGGSRTGQGPAYTGWDKDSTTLCTCDAGYFGADCSRKMCPKGDDPVTVAQNNRQIEVSITNWGNSATSLSGVARFTFELYTMELDMGNLNDASCTNAWNSLPNVKEASCNVTTYNTDMTRKMNVTFLDWPTFPKENNIYSHTGNPPLDHFWCDVSGMNNYADLHCNITDVISDNVFEYDFCANRGLCDFESGTCLCFDEYAGANCANPTFESTIDSSSNALPGLSMTATGLDYTGNIVELLTQKAAASDFNFLLCEADGQEYCSISGTGQFDIGSLTVLYDGVTINSGGLNLEYGGSTVVDGGMTIQNKYGGENVLTVTAADTTQFQKNIIDLTTKRTDADTLWNYIRCGEDGTNDMFTMRGDGYTTLGGTGLLLTDGGQTISKTGLHINDGGETITSGGMLITDGGLTIRESGVEIENSDHTKKTLYVYHDTGSASTVPTDTIMKITTDSDADSSYDIFSINYDELNSADTIFRVNAKPRTIIERGGLEIYAGGLNVSAGGFRVSGGINVTSGTIHAPSSLYNVVGLITSASITQTTGNIATVGDATIAGSLDVTSGITSAGILTQIANIYVDTGNVYASNGLLTIKGIENSQALTQTGNVFLSTGNVVATSGTLEIAGISTTAAITISASNIHMVTSGNIDGAGTYFNGVGLALSGGVTMAGNVHTTGNFYMTSGDFTVATGTVSIGVLNVNGLTSNGVITQTGNLFLSGASDYIVNKGISDLQSGIVSGSVITQSGNIFMASGNLFVDAGHIKTVGMTTTAALTVAGSSNIHVTGNVNTVSKVNTVGLVTTGVISSSANIVTSANIDVSGTIDVVGITSTGILSITSNIWQPTGNLYSPNGLLTIDGIASSGAITINVGTSNLYAKGNVVVTRNIIGSKGIVLAGTITHTSGNLLVQDGNLVVEDHVTVTTGDLVVSAGTANVASTLTVGGTISQTAGNIYNAANLVSGGQGTFGAGISVTGVATVTTNVWAGNNLDVANALTVGSGGLVVSTAAITANGANIFTTNEVVTVGMWTTGAITLTTSNIHMQTSGNINTAGGYLNAAGVVATGVISNSANIHTTGNVKLTAGVLTVAAGNIDVTSNQLNVDGITSTGVLSITGNIEQPTGNLYSPNGLLTIKGITNSAALTFTDASANLFLKGNIIVQKEIIASGGFSLTGGITQQSGNFETNGNVLITNDLTVSSGDLDIQSGAANVASTLTVGGTISQTAGNIYNAANLVSGGRGTFGAGISVTGVATVTTNVWAGNNLDVANALTVGSGGLVVSTAAITANGANIFTTNEVVTVGMWTTGAITLTTSNIHMQTSGNINTAGGYLNAAGVVATAAITNSANIHTLGNLYVKGNINLDASEGQVGIGLDGGINIITGALTVTAGNIHASGNVHCVQTITSSDERMKKNIKPLSGNVALKKLSKISGVKFQWRDGNLYRREDLNGKLDRDGLSFAPEHNEKKGTAVSFRGKDRSITPPENPRWSVGSLISATATLTTTSASISNREDLGFQGRIEDSAPGLENIGFIAQEVRQTFPELVHENINGQLGVIYDGFIPLLVEAVKEQQEEITVQRKQSEDLHERLSSLEKKIEELEERLAIQEKYSEI